MRRSTRMLQGWVMAIAAAGLLAACSDDNNDGGGGPTTLEAPTGVAVAQTSLTTATVSWTAAAGATGYLVERAGSDNPGTFGPLGNGPVSGTSFDDTGLSSSLTYSYRMASVSASDTSDFGTPISFTIGLKAATITGPLTESRTLFADTVYTLSGYVKVQNGATLTIQPGTRIIGDTTQAGSSLWILRGAKIDAEGAADAPIVFTSARSPGNRKPGD